MKPYSILWLVLNAEGMGECHTTAELLNLNIKNK